MRLPAAEWLEGQLAAPCEGLATVVFHSIMWWYLSEEERGRVSELISAAGRRASAGALLAWLCFELMETRDPEVRLTRWPSGVDELLAHADPHGRYVRWR